LKQHVPLFLEPDVADICNCFASAVADAQPAAMKATAAAATTVFTGQFFNSPAQPNGSEIAGSAALIT